MAFAMTFFQVLPITDKNNATYFWCVKALKVLTHKARFVVASSVTGRTSKKGMAHRVVSKCFSSKHSKTLCLYLSSLAVLMAIFSRFFSVNLVQVVQASYSMTASM